MLKVQCKIFNFRWEHISTSFYNAKLSHVLNFRTLRHACSSVQSYVCWRFNVSDTGLKY